MTSTNSWILQVTYLLFFLQKIVKERKRHSLLSVVLRSCLCRNNIKIRWDNTTSKHETDLKFITRLLLIATIFLAKRKYAKPTFCCAGPFDFNFREIKIYNNTHFTYISFKFLFFFWFELFLLRHNKIDKNKTSVHLPSTE